MTRIGEAKVCKTVGELREAIKKLPDHLCFGGEDDCITVEVWKLNRADDELSYDYEKYLAQEGNRKADFRRVTIEEGENDGY